MHADGVWNCRTYAKSKGQIASRERSLPDVSTEPRLQPMHDEVLQLRSANRNDEARLDVRASDFWCKGQEAFFWHQFFLTNCLLLPKRSCLTIPLAWKREEKGICPASAWSGTWSVHPFGFCIHWRYGQGVYHGFQENCRHLIWQEDAILTSHPLNQVPTFLCPNPISNQGHYSDQDNQQSQVSIGLSQKPICDFSFFILSLL